MLNTITIMGRLTQEPEIRKVGSDISVIDFCVACDRDIAKKGAEKKTDFINCTAWRGTADFVGRNFTKGSPICINGRLQIDRYEDREGNKRDKAYINVDNAYFAGGKKVEKAAPAIDMGGDDDFANTNVSFSDLDDDGELPF